MDIDETIQIAVEQYQAGNLQQAEQICGKILKEQPKNFDALQLLGVIYYQFGNFDFAIQYFKKALHIRHNIADLNYNLGNAYIEKRQFDKAIQCYQKAIQLNPNLAEAHHNLGNTYMEKRQFDGAIFCYQKVIQLNPSSDIAYNSLGDAFDEKGELDEAILCYQKALQINPHCADPYNYLGTVFHKKGQFDEAISCYQKALQLNSNFTLAYCNIAKALYEKGEISEALTYYQKTLQLEPDLADAHLNMSLALLLSGDFKQGWREYEWRKELKDFYMPDFSQPTWDGSDIKGKTILLHAEQGYGDTIQFIRYVPLIVQRGAKVIVECLKELKSLLQNVESIDKIIVRGEQLPKFDVYRPLLSLPLVFDTALESIPANIPYITTDSILLKKWQEKVHSDRSKFKIGLVWSGNPRHVNEKKRSCPLEIFSSLSLLNDITFYSLQKGEAAKQAKYPPEGLKLVDYTEEINDFSDTAAFIENLDLIISVDTAVSHLAGALGKSVWTLVPFVPDWRWMLNRDNSPWYPTMRLFRQPSPGDWESVIDKIKDELLKLLNKN